MPFHSLLLMLPFAVITAIILQIIDGHNEDADLSAYNTSYILDIEVIASGKTCCVRVFCLALAYI